MLISSLLLGIAIGFLIKPAYNAHCSYWWYRIVKKYGVIKSIKHSLMDDIWS